MARLDTHRVQIEPEFNQIVVTVGGQLVSSLVGDSPPFDNADYIFPAYRLVGELKCIEEDKLADPRMQEKFRRLWIKWRQQSLVSGAVPRVINLRSLPQLCQAEMYEVMAKPIRRRLQKANKQIRETKAALGLNDYRGVLFIANDGNLMFPPAAMIHAIQLSLHRDFREIRHFVFFTANLYLAARGINKPILCWISFDMDNNRSGPAETLYTDLYHRWVARHEDLTGIPAVKQELRDEDMEGFWFADFLR
jgi:hypothetical protein